MTNLDSILQSRDITLPTKVHLVRAMVFPVVMYECESGIIKKTEHHVPMIYFRLDWMDLLEVQGTLKSLLQSSKAPNHNSKALVLWHSAFFIAQLSHPHLTTGKTITLTRWIFVDKVVSLLFNMLSRLVITFLPRSRSIF